MGMMNMTNDGICALQDFKGIVGTRMVERVKSFRANPEALYIDFYPEDGKFSLDEIREAHEEMKVFNQYCTQRIDNLADFIKLPREVVHGPDGEVFSVILKQGGI